MSSRMGTNMTQREKFDYINHELRSFYEYCKEAGISDEEMDVICRPLTNAMRRATIKRWTRVCLFVLMMIAVGYTVSQTETFQWHASAVARVALIKLLPIWDWTPLYYNKCLLQKPENSDGTIGAAHITPEDCVACEAIKSVPRVANTGYREVFYHHLLRGSPVIVTDANSDWAPEPAENLTGIIKKSDRLQVSVPCRILSNMKYGRETMDLEEVVTKIFDSSIPSWFIHFQNCDIKAVKAFRVLAPRPYFLAPHIAPSHFSWIIRSNNYESNKYKHLELDVGLIMMSQLKGKSFVQLRPKTLCEYDCTPLDIELDEGETLVLGNSLWEFYYYSGKGDTMATVTETDWLDA